MKKCYKCKQEKSENDFHKNKNKIDGLQNYCKVCAKTRNRSYYLSTPHRNPQRQASREKSRRTAAEFVWNHLSKNACVDCGITNIIVLEFDHVRGVKTHNVSEMVGRGLGLDSIRLEIAKCEVRCANCHRIATATRGNWNIMQHIANIQT